MKSSNPSQNPTPSVDELSSHVKLLEECIKKLSRGGMLSSRDFFDLHVTKEEEKDYLEKHRSKDWDASSMYKNVKVQINNPDDISKLITIDQCRAKFLIKSFHPLNVTPFSYDLSIGNQAYSLKDVKKRSFTLDETIPYEIQPRETIIVLTEEYIALPPHYSATIWPRFSHVREGIFQSMVKIDPTWRGKTAVALTNVSPAIYPIIKGQLFATLILYELTRTSKYLLVNTKDIESFEMDFPETWVGKHDKAEINDRLSENKLLDLCEFITEGEDRSYLLFKEKGRNRNNFEKLLRVYNDREWKSKIREAIDRVVGIKYDDDTGGEFCFTEKGMDAYDLDNLDRILEGEFLGND